MRDKVATYVEGSSIAFLIMEGVAGVYLSYPFCAQKCTYCNFASGVLPRAVELAYPEALLREIEATKFAWTPETVYLGGGTPSSMGVDTLERVLAALPGKPWREATIEVSPGTMDILKIEAWRRNGINRVSLGVQSFQREELKRTGRRHTAEIVAADIALFCEQGLTNINIDLIAGLPGQTAASWAASLDWIERLEPPHVSVYMLEVDEDSRLGRELLLGGVRYGALDTPDEEATAAMYEEAVDRLARLGIHRYEISNFARHGWESAHNLKYWRREPYLGFGADAHSFDGTRRWQNVERAEDYIQHSPFAKEKETTANAMEEKFFVGLRLDDGIELDDADWMRHSGLIHRFIHEGLLQLDQPRLRLTDRGVMVSNEIMQEFLAS